MGKTVSSGASFIQSNSEKGHKKKISYLLFFLIPLVSFTPFLLIALTKRTTINTVEKSHLGLGLSRLPPLSHAVVHIKVDDELENQFISAITDLELLLTSTLDITQKKTVIDKIRSFVNNIGNPIEYGVDNILITHDNKNDPNSATELYSNSQAKKHIIQESAARKIEHAQSSVKNDNGSSTDDADGNFLEKTTQYSKKVNENLNFKESAPPKTNGVQSKNNTATISKTVINSSKDKDPNITAQYSKKAKNKKLFLKESTPKKIKKPKIADKKKLFLKESDPKKIKAVQSSVKNDNGSITDDADSHNSKNNAAIHSKLVLNGPNDNILDKTTKYSKKANKNLNFKEPVPPKTNGVHSKNKTKKARNQKLFLKESTPKKIKGVLPISMASPKIIRGFTYTFPSIPAEKRVYSNKERNNEKEPDTLYMYNPTIIPIPSSYLPYLVFNNTQQKPSYFISFRVSTAQSCHGGRNFQPIWYNLIGLAVLDLSLKLIPGSDVVFSTNDAFYTRHKFEDVRLFVLNGKVHISNKFQLYRIMVSTPNTKMPSPQPSETYFPIPTKYGSGLNVQAVKYLQEEKKHWWNLGNVPWKLEKRGKNFSYITSEYTPGQYFLDFTMGEWLAPVNVANNTMGKMFQRGVKPRPSFQSSISPIGNDVGFTRDRGTVCCTRIEREYYSDLDIDPSIKELSHIMVGILHAKTKTKELHSMGETGFVYMSRLYALSPHLPFDMLARSGFLCFGFGDQVETKEEPFANFAEEKKVVINGNTEKCPVIHFASGLTEKIDDNSSLIVGYGINDCVGRFAEISKREFVKKMFGFL